MGMNTPAIFMRKTLLSEVCESHHVIEMNFWLNILFVLLALFSYVFVDYYSSDFYVLSFASVFIVANILLSGLAIHYCKDE